MSHVVRDYQLLTKIGQNAVSQLWLAEHMQLGTKATIRVFADWIRFDGQHGQQLMTEIRALSALKHDHLIALQGGFSLGSHCFLVFEHFQGANFDQLIGADTPLPVNDALAMSQSILSALEYAHQQGITHRNLKPANVIRGENGQVKISDFALVLHARTGQGQSRIVPIGSPYYRSPEQIRDPRLSHPAIDIYATGILLYRMLTGHPPFRGDARAVLQSHLQEIPRAPHLLNPHVPEPLSGLVLKAIAKDPADRFPSCAAMSRDLQACRGDLRETRSSPPEPLRSRQAGKEESSVPTMRTPKTPPLPSQAPKTTRKQKSSLPFLDSARRIALKLNLFLVTILALATALAVPFILRILPGVDHAGIPILAGRVLSIFYQGTVSSQDLYLSISVFSFVFSSVWLIYDQLVHESDLVLCVVNLLGSLAAALFNLFVVFSWALPVVVSALVDLNVISAHYGSNGYGGYLLSDVLCVFLWFLTLAAMAALARFASRGVVPGPR